MAGKTSILLVGETWFVLTLHVKGFDMFPLGGYENFGVWFMEAMGKFPDIQAEHMPNHVALTSFPSTLEQLKRYDVLIFSDCGKNTISLYPEMFTVPMGPDRLPLIKEYVEKGKAFVMAGGWNSFQGLRGIPGYHGTVIEEILPVQIQESDDRVETPQGVRPKVMVPGHPIFADLPSRWPLFLGYNRVVAKEGAEVLATINGDPLIAVSKCGRGKTMAFTSDLAKHWGTDFVAWKGYGAFWHNALLWLSGRG
jgi:uncharacterized membrane protein